MYSSAEDRKSSESKLLTFHSVHFHPSLVPRPLVWVWPGDEATSTLVHLPHTLISFFRGCVGARQTQQGRHQDNATRPLKECQLRLQ